MSFIVLPGFSGAVSNLPQIFSFHPDSSGFIMIFRVYCDSTLETKLVDRTLQKINSKFIRQETPLVFTITGIMGPECLQFHKSLAEKLAKKSGERYSDVMNYIRCKLSFMCVRSSLLCLRGSRTIRRRDQVETDFALHNLELNLEG